MKKDAAKDAFAEALISLAPQLAKSVVELLVVSVKWLAKSIERGMPDATDEERNREWEVFVAVVENTVLDVENADPPVPDKRAAAFERIWIYVRSRPELAHVRKGQVYTQIELAHDRLEDAEDEEEGT
jgi:hypothetical protein